MTFSTTTVRYLTDPIPLPPSPLPPPRIHTSGIEPALSRCHAFKWAVSFKSTRARRQIPHPDMLSEDTAGILLPMGAGPQYFLCADCCVFSYFGDCLVVLPWCALPCLVKPCRSLFCADFPGIPTDVGSHSDVWPLTTGVPYGRHFHSHLELSFRVVHIFLCSLFFGDVSVEASPAERRVFLLVGVSSPFPAVFCLLGPSSVTTGARSWRRVNMRNSNNNGGPWCIGQTSSSANL